MLLQAYNPRQQHLVVISDFYVAQGSVANSFGFGLFDSDFYVAQGSVANSFGFGLFDTVTQGIGLREANNSRLENNIREVTQLNYKLAEAFSTLTPNNLDKVISLTKHVNQIGKTAQIGCSVCGVDLVRTAALQKYNDDLEHINGISSRYSAIFEALKNADASPDETYYIVQWIVKRDDAIASTDVAEKDDFARALRQIAGDNCLLKDFVENLIIADEQKALDYSQHTAANKNKQIPKNIHAQHVERCIISLKELKPLAELTKRISTYHHRKMLRTDDEILQSMKNDRERTCEMYVQKNWPFKEFEEIREILQKDPNALLEAYDKVMTQAKNISGIVLKKLMLLDKDKRVVCLVDQSYLSQLFFIFPQIYRCCVIITGEEKAFQSGTIQSQWREAYHQFRASMCTILNDSELSILHRANDLFANFLEVHTEKRKIDFYHIPAHLFKV